MARTKYDPAEARERAQEKVREALTLPVAGIGAIVDSASFARYLRCLARFHRYSTANVALILMQRPDATRVAGYRAWQALGRQVRKGGEGHRDPGAVHRPGRVRARRRRAQCAEFVR
jgi:hypothetical protein